MAEGSETPGGESGAVPEGRGLGEGDLLSERRARRAAESGETALVRRAEAAEATVRTLEAHVASLQQRLHGAEEQTRRMSELIEAERVPVTDLSLTEQELRRAKQREYAEQRLRVEAEDRGTDLERESRIEIDRLTRRLDTSEQRSRDLARQLEQAQRKLAEAEQAAATETAAARRGEHAFQVRLTVLERRALEVQRGLEVERAARERSERLLESTRQGHRRVEALVGDLGGVVGRLRAVTAAAPARGETAPTEAVPDASGAPRLSEPPVGLEPGSGSRSRPGEVNREMTDALAAAVERLRARVEDVGDGPEVPPRSSQAAGQPAAAPAAEASSAIATAQGDEPARPLADDGVPPARPADDGEPPTAPIDDGGRATPAGAQGEPATAPVVGSAGPRVKPPPHKHSMSLMTRLRLRRKDRRERRSAAAEPPSIPSQ